MKTYFNMKTPEGIETIDEFDSADFPDNKAYRQEVKRCFQEYRMTMDIYVSSRSTKAWRER